MIEPKMLKRLGFRRTVDDLGKSVYDARFGSLRVYVSVVDETWRASCCGVFFDDMYVGGALHGLFDLLGDSIKLTPGERSALSSYMEDT